MRAGIQEHALRVMLEGGAVREVLVSHHNEKWTLAIRLGGAGSRYARAARRCVPGRVSRRWDALPRVSVSRRLALSCSSFNSPHTVSVRR